MTKNFLSRFAALAVCMFILFGAGLILQPSHANAQETTPPPKPNIILISTDDMGWGDLCKNYPSNPNCANANFNKNLTTLADGGMTFSNFYTPTPLCTPSRAALMTGRDPRRVGVSGMVTSDHYLKKEEITLAKTLSENGYRTAIVGKWNLGWGTDST